MVTFGERECKFCGKIHETGKGSVIWKDLSFCNMAHFKAWFAETYKDEKPWDGMEPIDYTGGDTK